MRASIVLTMTLAMLALACGREEPETPTGSARPAATPPAASPDVGARPEAARPTPSSPAPPSPTAPSAATQAGGDPVSECRALAAQQAWERALEPCTRAARQLPDDLEIRHALQQAQAAATERAQRAMGGVEIPRQ